MKFYNKHFQFMLVRMDVRHVSHSFFSAIAYSLILPGTLQLHLHISVRNILEASYIVCVGYGSVYTAGRQHCGCMTGVEWQCRNLYPIPHCVCVRTSAFREFNYFSTVYFKRSSCKEQALYYRIIVNSIQCGSFYRYLLPLCVSVSWPSSEGIRSTCSETTITKFVLYT
jgi:hypothetical protein